ncbi:hypothetical protein [Salisediminibacterium beveridgei]|uniref:Uncharacterized protein n=1 Tax=Salisediminibacterium beveridgei TaxID=632773 RepID=A0A1D7QZG3_9BACI|nr:hypothetical protein [Salisediminibacterium beveridgei]AOM84397.1 hypothetical protein BBEV_3080 [Salisediminibacterium beveridgei]
MNGFGAMTFIKISLVAKKMNGYDVSRDGIFRLIRLTFEQPLKKSIVATLFTICIVEGGKENERRGEDDG